LTHEEIASAILAVVKPPFAAEDYPLNYFRAKGETTSEMTPWGRLTVQPIDNNKRAITAKIGNRLMSSMGLVTVQLFARPDDQVQKMNALFQNVEWALQDHRAGVIEFTNIRSDLLGTVEGWDTINITADYSAYFRR